MITRTFLIWSISLTVVLFVDSTFGQSGLLHRQDFLHKVSAVLKIELVYRDYDGFQVQHSIGHGVMISPHALLTAAHVVVPGSELSKDSRIKRIDIGFSHADYLDMDFTFPTYLDGEAILNRTIFPFPREDLDQCEFDPKIPCLSVELDATMDLALIVLPESLVTQEGTSLGFVGPSSHRYLTDVAFVKEKVGVISDFSLSGSISFDDAECHESTCELKNYKAVKGMSGSPIVAWDSGSGHAQVVGIMNKSQLDENQKPTRKFHAAMISNMVQKFFVDPDRETLRKNSLLLGSLGLKPSGSYDFWKCADPNERMSNSFIGDYVALEKNFYQLSAQQFRRWAFCGKKLFAWRDSVSDLERREANKLQNTENFGNHPSDDIFFDN